MNLDSDRPHGNIKIHVFGNLQTYGGKPAEEEDEPAEDEPERFRPEIEV